MPGGAAPIPTFGDPFPLLGSPFFEDPLMLGCLDFLGLGSSMRRVGSTGGAGFSAEQNRSVGSPRKGASLTRRAQLLVCESNITMFINLYKYTHLCTDIHTYIEGEREREKTCGWGTGSMIVHSGEYVFPRASQTYFARTVWG